MSSEGIQGGDAGAATPVRWRDVWQAPLLALAALALISGIIAAVLTAPKPEAVDHLARAEKLIDEGKYAEGVEALNKEVLPLLAAGQRSPDVERRFHLLRARGLYKGQRELGIDRAENHEAIREEYVAAERLHAVLEGEDRVHIAETLLSLGDLSGAAVRAEMLPDAQRPQRISLLKRIVERSLSGRTPDRGRALDLVTSLAADPELSRDDRAWTLARQGELLIDAGYADEAITKIVRGLPRLEGVEGESEAELRVTLARAYMSTEGAEEARTHLNAALTKLSEHSRLRPLATLMLAELDHRDGEFSRARDGYRSVLDEIGLEEKRSAALLGLAEVECRLAEGEDAEDEGLRRYTELVELLRAERASHPQEDIDRAGASLMSRFRERDERGELAEALRFALLAERLHGIDASPAEVLLAIAATNRRLAEGLLSHAAEGGALSLAEADPATQREAREHLLLAGEYYRMHATRTIQDDTVAYADSLWAAADTFDRAGDVDASAQAFRQFIADLPADARRPEAMFRLAQAYRARGDLELAAGLYQTLIDERGGERGTGPWGDQSIVPLAKTLLEDADPDNDARGEQLLAQVVEGAATGPGTPVFREALRELGEHWFRRGRYAGAIERFEQYLAIAEKDAEPGADLTPARYRLADALRRSGAEIARALQSAMPDGNQRDLMTQRRTRLARAQQLYEDVRSDYEARPRRTGVEDLYLRNAYFFKGDCAFDLEDYEGAIRAYDAARERYAKDPAALVAMTQIVSALVRMGRLDQAAAANERAKRFYASLPESVWDDPMLPMSRADWERWLAAQDHLSARAAVSE
ncbi:MAG: tetratricopeptide repeat protein [Planctomycetota bacterium]|nr:tetratricopeptide repeat protein [Planctomycetota bacterium]